MPLYLNNDDQERSTRVIDAINAMDRILQKFARGDAIRRPRIDNFLPTSRGDEFRAPR